LPRWALSCYWRGDGVPLWDDPSLFADESKDYGHGDVHAEAFINSLAARLGIDPAQCLPGYEDAWYYLWKERRLPSNVDPLAADLDDPETAATRGEAGRAHVLAQNGASDRTMAELDRLVEPSVLVGI
ncbi:transglutaminase family protein, partial [Singulisphaera rosea]